MRDDRYPYEFPVVDIVRAQGAERTAGVFMLEGRCHIAAYWSQAARSLVERGALHVATLRFDADPLERSHERPVEPVRMAEMVRRFPPGPERN